MSRANFRAVVTLLIIAGFFAAFFLDPANETFRGAIVTAFAAAWGYWLGSSQGAHENREQLNRLAEQARQPQGER